MPRGGKRPGAGRPKGSRSAATKQQQARISDLARQYGETALDALVDIATRGESESARGLARVWCSPLFPGKSTASQRQTQSSIAATAKRSPASSFPKSRTAIRFPT